MTSAPIAVTLGEPSGVGPDIVLSLWMRRRETLSGCFILADPAFVRRRAERLGHDIVVRTISEPSEAAGTDPMSLPVLPLINRHEDNPGHIDPANAAGTIEAIDRATALALSGDASAIVTGPIDKKALYDAGFRHPGHTEYLADLCTARTGDACTPVMLLYGPSLACVPVTIHIPLRDVPFRLTRELVEATCRITAVGYRDLLGITAPRLAVSGLNPHAGERGAIGSEDETVVRPAVLSLRAEGFDIVGPLPGDTMFHAEARTRYDVAICMYHDQALIPAKTLAFDQTVNATLGLPIIRTSPDHGTAADLAGSGNARPNSFLAAIGLARRMAQTRLEAPGRR